MQSGITASPDLQTAFHTFLNTRTLFALLITITSESLTPLRSLPFPPNSSFTSSLPLLSPHLDPKTPVYLILRRHAPESKPPSSDEGADGDAMTIVTYIPSSAAVRAKTLFASTRATLIRELGRERFEGRGGNLFVTERREILDVGEWKGREGRGEEGEGQEVLTIEERELRSVRRAEEEERYGGGTKGRDLMGVGGSGNGGGGGGEGELTNNLRMKMDDEARKALVQMSEGISNQDGGVVVQLAIDLSTEMLILSSSSSNVSPAELSSNIPAEKPSYTFYHYPASTSVIFIYCCPGSSKIKERMLYASSRANVVVVARDEGIEVSKRIEIGAPDEIGEDRLRAEVGPSAPAANEETGSGASRAGFARPKRPGKR